MSEEFMEPDEGEEELEEEKAEGLTFEEVCKFDPRAEAVELLEKFLENEYHKEKLYWIPQISTLKVLMVKSWGNQKQSKVDVDFNKIITYMQKEFPPKNDPDIYIQPEPELPDGC